MSAPILPRPDAYLWSEPGDLTMGRGGVYQEQKDVVGLHIPFAPNPFVQPLFVEAKLLAAYQAGHNAALEQVKAKIEALQNKETL